MNRMTKFFNRLLETLSYVDDRSGALYTGTESTYTFCFLYDTLSRLPPPPLALSASQARSSRDTGKSPSSLGLADFDLLRVIGRGSYAKVLLVQLKKTERIYAMKVVKKELVNDDEVKYTNVRHTS